MDNINNNNDNVDDWKISVWIWERDVGRYRGVVVRGGRRVGYDKNVLY